MSDPSVAPSPAPNHAFGSDNTAGVCPEAFAALAEANAGHAGSYGDDPWTERAKRLMRDVFETDCEVFFVFNGTASNSLALAACRRSAHTRVICHSFAHIETDECGAPEFFSGGGKMTPVATPGGKLNPAAVAPFVHLGHGVHSPRAAVLSLTQSTEWGTVYTPQEIAALAAVARAEGMAVHMDGARFANAAAALADRGAKPADLTWKAGVDVLSFGGTKNGMLTTEAVVFFNHELAAEFDYRVKQGGQLASKLRFASAQWVAMLSGDAWRRNAAHANHCAHRLAEGLRAVAGLRLVLEPEVNAVFVEVPPNVAARLQQRGWQFYRFIGEHGYRLMCSWATRQSEIDAFVRDAQQAAR